MINSNEYTEEDYKIRFPRTIRFFKDRGAIQMKAEKGNLVTFFQEDGTAVEPAMSVEEIKEMEDKLKETSTLTEKKRKKHENSVS